jgi:hypothetical protein
LSDAIREKDKRVELGEVRLGMDDATEMKVVCRSNRGTNEEDRANEQGLLEGIEEEGYDDVPKGFPTSTATQGRDSPMFKNYS